MPFDQFARFHQFNMGPYLMLPIMLILLLIGTTTLLGILLYRRFSASKYVGGSALPTDETPEDTLKRRFAEGQISKEEFEERMTELIGRTDHPL